MGVQAYWDWCKREALLASTLAGVLCGITLGLTLAQAELSEDVIKWIGLPGSLMLRSLKMLVLPLVVGSMIEGVCSLQGSTHDMGRAARLITGLYAVSTVIAVLLGLLCVTILRPGAGAPFASGGESDCHVKHAEAIKQQASGPSQATSPAEALYKLSLDIVPENLMSAAVNNNILGLITFSLLFGAAICKLPPEVSVHLTQPLRAFNTSISCMMTWLLWLSPVGVASLIIESICSTCNLGSTLGAIGMFIVTVVTGLTIQAAIVLPIIYMLITRLSPLPVLQHFSAALVMAFGADSSVAALPLSLDSAKAAGVPNSLANFALPLGATVNMNGTALYEAVTVIFIAQANGVDLTGSQLVVIALTATLAAVGAASVPSAGLVTMLMVLQAVHLERFAGDLAVIFAIDWLLDRMRTVVNVLGDAYTVCAVSHLMKQGSGGGQYVQLSNVRGGEPAVVPVNLGELIIEEQ